MCKEKSMCSRVLETGANKKNLSLLFPLSSLAVVFLALTEDTQPALTSSSSETANSIGSDPRSRSVLYYYSRPVRESTLDV